MIISKPWIGDAAKQRLSHDGFVYMDQAPAVELNHTWIADRRFIGRTVPVPGLHFEYSLYNGGLFLSEQLWGEPMVGR